MITLVSPNYVLIREVTLNASASSVTFSSIPSSGYTDLKLVISGRGSASGYWTNIYLTFNGSSSSYSTKLLYDADGTAGSATSGSSSYIQYGYVPGSSATANTFCNTEIYVPNYLSSNYKSVSIDTVTENNGSNILLGMTAGLWSNTAAINSITLALDNSNWVANTTVSLYGIAAVGTTPTVVPKASGGDIVVNDGTYWYHAFLSSGTFIPNTTLSANVLCVAGGGGGYFGGGGAGGFLGLTSQSLAGNTSYAAVVGAGGVGGKVSVQSSTQGSNSQLGSLTAAVGGGYGGPNGNAGGTGGSGGGSANGTNASGTSGQGNAGGSGSWGGYYVGGGGGGAGAVGTNSSGSTAGSGGAGLNTYSSWATATGTGASGYYAGGGGGASSNSSGASGGSGGGGAGGNSPAVGIAGTINTGGGGGGTDGNYGGAGGSGIVIIRYAMA